jgi:hypothetical protein
MNPRAFISTRASIANTAYSTADRFTPTTVTLFHSFKASLKLSKRWKKKRE